jgi:hypothetical protein
MKSQNPRLERLKELLSLEERRVSVQQDLESITQRMVSLRDSLFDEGGAPTSQPDSPARESAPSRGGRPRGPLKRGALKEHIASALEAAGSAGVRVTELAKELGVKPVNIHSWFHSSLKRFPQIKKLKGGHYRLEGKLDLAAGARKRGRPRKTDSPQAAAPRPVGRPPKNGSAKSGNGSSSSSSGTRRGALAEKVLSELKKGGSKGVSVRDLASKIGANYRNIYIWFATTGKKNPKIKRIAPATYRLES